MLALLLTAALTGFPAQGVVTSTSFGMGLGSCSHWLADPTSQRDGDNWLLGFWSALNVFNAARHDVGLRTDGDGRFGEVRSVCLAHPSMSLQEATETAYQTVMAAGR